MAIMDAKLELSDNQAITATAAAENVINFGDSDLEIGTGTPLYLNVVVGTAFDSAADDGTLTVALVNDSAVPIDGSSVVVYQTPAIAEATLVAGHKILRMPLPANVDEQQYVGLYYTVAGSGNFTAGKLDAWIDYGSQSSHDVQVAQS